jgi:hypothetical protein
MVGSMAVSMVG